MCCPCLMIFTNKCLITFTNKFLLVVLFSCQVLTNFLQLHGLQHTRLPCPLPSPGVCSNTCPLSQWCYLSISSSATLFSFCLQSLPTSGSFPVSHLFTSAGQSVDASGSASVLPMKIQGWFPLGLTRFDLLSVLGTLKSLLQHHSSKSSILQHTVFMFQLSHPYMIIGKIIALTVCSHFSAKWCLCFLIRCVGFS